MSHRGGRRTRLERVDARWRTALGVPDDEEPLGTAFLALLLMAPTWFVVRQILPIALQSWRHSVQILGLRPTLGLAWRLTRIRHRQSFRAVRLTAPEFTLLPLLIAIRSLTTRWSRSLIDPKLYESIEFALLSIAWTIAATRPPVALYLGSSQYGGFATLKGVRAEGAYAVSLIDQASPNVIAHYHEHYASVEAPPGRMQSLLQAASRSRMFDPTVPRDDSLRTKHRHWQRTVLELMDCVPVLVLDARDAGRQIQQEALWALAPGRRHKALFIVDDDDEHVVPPLLGELERLGISLAGTEIRTSAETHAGEAIRSMTRSSTARPRVTDVAEAPALDAALAHAQERFAQLESVYRDLLARVRAGTEPDRVLDADLSRLTDAAPADTADLTSSLDAALRLANDLLNQGPGLYSWRIDIMTDGTAVVELGMQDRPGNQRVFESRASDNLNSPRAVLDVLLQALLA